MNLRRIYCIARKEVFHIVRDPFTLALALGLPLVFVTVFGLAIEFNLKDIRISAYDGDRTEASRVLLESFESSNYFKISRHRELSRALSDLDTERAKAALVIERGFERDARAGRVGKAQLLLDGADNSTVGIILSYVGGIQKLALRRLTASSETVPLKLQTRFLYNPELKSRWFTIPGLIVIVTAVFSILLTALTVAREWENGSMELLLSTPAHPFEIVAGKLVPYVFLGFGAILFVYAVARLGFQVPFRGSHFVFALGTVLFIVAYLSQGLVISVVTRSQQLAMQIAFVSGLLPSILLSGFVFPIENMPVFFQYFTAIFPARWFMVICRSVFLRGAGLADLAQPFAALLVLDAILMAVATRRFKRDVEP